MPEKTENLEKSLLKLKTAEQTHALSVDGQVWPEIAAGRTLIKERNGVDGTLSFRSDRRIAGARPCEWSRALQARKIDGKAAKRRSYA